MNAKQIHRIVSALALAILLLAANARAADGIWTNSATGTFNWSDTANWASGTIADGTGFTAYFDTLDVPSGGITVNVDAGRTVGNLRLGDISGSHPYSFGGELLTLAVGSGNAKVTVINGTQTITFNSQLASASTLEKAGPGALLLRSNLTQEVKWLISDGVVDLAYPSGTALSGPFAAATPDALTLDGGTLRLNWLYYNVANQGITLGAGGGTIDVPGGTTSVLDSESQKLSGPGGFTKSGGGVLQIKPANNTYSGDTVIAQGSLVYRFYDDVIPDGAGKGNVVVSTGAILDLSGRSETINGLSGGGVVDNTTLVQISNSTLTIGANDADGTFTGVVANGNSAGKVLNLVKTGTGTQTLSGANSYTGTTTVDGGVLNVSTLSSNADYTINAARLGALVVAPTNSLGMGNLTVNTGSAITCNFGTNSNPSSSAIAAAGDFYANDNVTISVAGNNLSPGTVTLFKFAGYKYGSGAFTLGTLPTGMTATLADNTDTPSKDVALTISSVGYTLTYLAAANGAISGVATQVVALGANGAAVTATPNSAFRFSRWSDGRTTATRVDTNVTASATYLAYFVSTNAVDGVWTQTATGIQAWTNTANWSGGVVATNIDAVANFATINVPSGQTVTNHVGRTVGTLIVGDTSGSDGYTFAGSPLTLAVSSGNGGIVASNSTQSSTFNSAVLSSNLIEKSGPGLINLRANATQVQKWLISGGTVNIDNNNRLTVNPASFTADALTLNGGTLQLNFLYWNNVNMGITLGAAGGTLNSPSGTSSLDNNASYITGSGSLTKAGGGILQFRPNGNSYAGDTIVAAGTLRLNYYDNCIPDGAGKGNLIVNSGATFDLAGQSDTINGLSGSGTVNNSTTGGNNNNSTLTVGNNNASSTFSGVLQNTSASKFLNLTKTGSGTLTLNGANTYKGATTVNAGTLNTTTLSTNSNYVLANNATLGIRCANTNSSLQLSNLTFNGSSATLNLNLGSSGRPVASVINVLNNLTNNGGVAVNIFGSRLTVGQVTLLKYAGTKSGGGYFYLNPLPPGMVAVLNDNTDTPSKDLVLDIQSLPSPQDIRWAVGDGAWDLVTYNWEIITNSTPTTYIDDYTVRFDDQNSATTNLINVTLASDMVPAGMTVSNATRNFTLTGPYTISGSSGLLKQGTGTVTVATTTAYAGDTTISGGTFKVGLANALPSGATAGNVLLNPSAGTAKLDLAGFSAGINGLNSTGAGTSVVDNSTGTATLTVGNNNATGTFSGSIRNTSGTLSLTKAGSGTLTLTSSNSYGGKTVLNGGTLVINSKNNLGVSPASFTADQLTLGATSGSQTVTLSNTASITFPDANRGVTVRDSGAWPDANIITPAGTTLAFAGSLSASASGTAVVLDKLGAGTLVLSNAANYNGTLVVDAGTVEFGSALNAGIFLKLLGLAVLGGGDYTAGIGFGAGLNQTYGNAGFAALSANRIVALGGGTVTWGDGNFQPNALILGAPQATHTLIFSSSIDLNGAARTIQADDGAAAVDGRITGVLSNGGLTKTGNGTLELTAANTYAGATTIRAGKLALAGAGTLANSTTISVSSNATFDVSGVSFTLGVGQSLGGQGTVIGNVIANGIVAPGASVGTLTFNNNLDLAGNTMMELDKSLSPSNDVLMVSGTLAYGGTLTLTNIGVTPLAVGDTFQLFSAGSKAGTFAALAGSPGAGLTWNFNPTAGVATVVSAAPPTLGLSQSGNVLTFSWSEAGYKLQSQTNSLNVGLAANWFDYPNGSTSPVSVTNSPANPSVFFRLAPQ